MNLNSDFKARVVQHAAEAAWTPSPLPGVDRRMLDRVGDEVARATSIVRYAAGSRFDEHLHHGGEEILVLEGLFQDEAGDYPAGTWLRNPRWSRHTPRSGPEGALIYVKVGAIDAPFMPLPGADQEHSRGRRLVLPHSPRYPFPHPPPGTKAKP
jgi:anti-sigma factor ChrR (cupin superfamily)